MGWKKPLHALVRLHFGYLLRFAERYRAMLAQDTDPIDIVQNTFLRAGLAQNRPRSVGNLRSWLTKIEWRVLLDENRRKRREASWLPPQSRSEDSEKPELSMRTELLVGIDDATAGPTHDESLKVLHTERLLIKENAPGEDDSSTAPDELVLRREQRDRFWQRDYPTLSAKEKDTLWHMIHHTTPTGPSDREAYPKRKNRLIVKLEKLTSD